MIPAFPEFKHLEWNDQKDVLQFTKDFPPYSDYNFVSMWCWNTREKMMVSQLHGNLVLLFYDYLTEAPFLSFIGKHELADTAKKLIEYSMRHYQENCLKLIPKDTALHLPETDFIVTPDPDADDYILSIPYLCSLDTITGASHPNAYLCKKFLRLYPQCHVQKCTSAEIAKGEYIDLFKRWAKAKNLDHFELNEYSAFEKFIQNKECDNHIVSIHDGDKMIAFSTYEILPDSYAICHFSKADIIYKGIYTGLYFILGKILQERNVTYWNFEQDLGIPELRRSKKKCKPEFYLEKYIVSQR